MREDLRTLYVKTLVILLRSQKGEDRAREVLASAGVVPGVLEQETGWISAETARRVYAVIIGEIGKESAQKAAELVAHREALGVWVRMVREATGPADAYKYIVAHNQEFSRLGEVSSSDEHPNGITLVYKPKSDDEAETDESLCEMRQMQFRGLPLLFGLPCADLKHERCLLRGSDCCAYKINWGGRPQSFFLRPVVLAIAGFVAAWGLVFALGGWIAASLAALVVGGLGFTLGTLLQRQKLLERQGVTEKLRVMVLERSLELRGDANVQTQGDLVGMILRGKYRIGRRIGSGGIGVVHVAEHIGLGTQVAIKVLRGAAAKDGAEIARLRREAQVSSALDHPNVVKVLDLDQLQDGSIYVVMELLRGRSLADKLHRDGPLAPGYAITVFRQVCLALAAAHDIGVVHRDLKPGNVFLLEDGETAKVLDFGMSKLANATAGEKLTQDGYTLGTPEYMAPEQCIGGQVEPRTDLYELGVLIYESLTGDLPIRSSNRRELLELHQKQVPPLMHQRRPDLPIPRELDEIVSLCLRKRVNERPPSARALERMLASVPLENVPMHYAHNVGRFPPNQRKSGESRRNQRN